MRHRLRFLLVGSAMALAASVLTIVGYSLLSSNPTIVIPAHAVTGGAAQRADQAPVELVLGPVTDTQVCGMVTSGEVYRLLDFTVPIGPGTPRPVVQGGACLWGTGHGKGFEVTVVPLTSGPGASPCAGTEVKAPGWVGCSQPDVSSGTVLRAVRGHYLVSIDANESVVDTPYLVAEAATITQVFRQLGT